MNLYKLECDVDILTEKLIYHTSEVSYMYLFVLNLYDAFCKNI